MKHAVAILLFGTLVSSTLLQKGLEQSDYSCHATSSKRNVHRAHGVRHAGNDFRGKSER